jgi:hypothetical protein
MPVGGMAAFSGGWLYLHFSPNLQSPELTKKEQSGIPGRTGCPFMRAAVRRTGSAGFPVVSVAICIGIIIIALLIITSGGISHTDCCVNLL